MAQIKNPELLLREYYDHLQHTEKERNSFLKIYLGISGASILGATYLKCPFQELLFYLFYCLISICAYNVMKKWALVIRLYNLRIKCLTKNPDHTENPDCTLYCYYDCMVRRDNLIPVSDSYMHLIIIIIIYNALLASNQMVYLHHCGNCIEETLFIIIHSILYFIIILIFLFVIKQYIIKKPDHTADCDHHLPEHIRPPRHTNRDQGSLLSPQKGTNDAIGCCEGKNNTAKR